MLQYPHHSRCLTALHWQALPYRPEPDFREDSTAGADDSIRRDPALAEGPDEQSDFGAFHTEKPEVVPSEADVFTGSISLPPE